MGDNGKRVVGTLIIRGALHQISEEDAVGGWVTKTYSATFAIEDREFAGVPRPGEKVNIDRRPRAQLRAARQRRQPGPGLRPLVLVTHDARVAA